ncbi:hypothetical protein E2562_006254 [Oryza meyeriana var. granulata]|uniref:Uncharacterized protein n=1 Tax=Oryza meyeriana var. granulata TaxID=110450 RepID=A0A6G1CQ58_9ORYZ|nr:hypothetical protein E2562_006254 [Oryza meyeriana var. granulata]
MKRVMVTRLKDMYQATFCSDINAAMKLLRERVKEFDFVVVSDALIRSLDPAAMKFFCETGLRIVILRREPTDTSYNFVPMPSSHMEQDQLEPVGPSATNSQSYASRLPAASSHGDSNGLMTAVVPPATAVASSGNRATNRRKRRRRETTAEQVISTQGEEVQCAQHQQRKPRLVWTTELHEMFEEACKILLPESNE